MRQSIPPVLQTTSTDKRMFRVASTNQNFPSFSALSRVATELDDGKGEKPSGRGTSRWGGTHCIRHLQGTTEFRLLRAELGEKIGLIGLGVGLVAGGAVLLIAAVVLLFVAGISALVNYGFGLTAAILIVFGTVLVAGAGCLWLGIRQLSVENLMPNKTIAQVQKDFKSITPETN